MNLWINKYAKLLAHYSLYLQPGELVYLRTTHLAHDLVREFAKECIKVGAILEVEMDYEGKEEILLHYGSTQQLQYFPEHSIDLISKCNAYLLIRAPYLPMFNSTPDEEKEKIRNMATKRFQEIYFERLGNGSLKRSLCQFPTLCGAQKAGMSLEEYTNFIIQACALQEDEPEQSWKTLSQHQQKIVDYLQNIKHLRYQHNDWSIECSVEGRKWINSDGKSNMPSGEVFTSPVEDSVNGNIRFSFPTYMYGEEIKNLNLTVNKGYIQHYSADSGMKALDRLFAIEGTRYFGEVAIGTNKNIQQATNNILFDEKIGGTVHMAVGQSYFQCGGKNTSTIHLDLITDMKEGGKIYADGKEIYSDGEFII